MAFNERAQIRRNGNVRNIGTPVLWLLARLESLRANNISYPIGRKVKCTGNLLLSIPGDIAAHDCEAEAEADGLTVAEPGCD